MYARLLINILVVEQDILVVLEQLVIASISHVTARVDTLGMVVVVPKHKLVYQKHVLPHQDVLDVRIVHHVVELYSLVCQQILTVNQWLLIITVVQVVLHHLLLVVV